MRFKEFLQRAEQASTTAEAKDRRRPGRNSQVSPHLIPLLRDPVTADIPAPLPREAETSPSDNDLATARGIVFSLVLSVSLWVWIAGVLWAVLH